MNDGEALDRARRAAREVTDPELPMLTIEELGVLRQVAIDPDGTVVATLTPTYSGCPAVAEMRAAVDRRLRAAGFPRVAVRTALAPPWTTDWITAAGRRKLAEHGIAPPGPAAPHPEPPGGGPGPGRPLPLTLSPTRRAAPPPCPRCHATDTRQTSPFSATPCRDLWHCRSCREPFEHVKEF
ncbi:1,2-phenylacetyl-CoA epoxidase subunit PaaD [Streptomyces sp. 4N509B]|uniref:1,2-phenylacetyl-CoA epoxidase subunit PaaD n=1 Tax=Streptomyces sp. 4N509B TaxID=3457413 RepID=UPI003FD41DC4